MIRSSLWHVLPVLAFGTFTLGCDPGGVGDPCVPEDEYQQGFNGFAEKEVNVESKSFQCETRVCIVNHFRGRVSCPYGQTADSLPGDAALGVPAGAAPLGPTDPARCRVPGTNGTHCIAGTSDGTPVECGGGSVNIDEIKVPVAPQLLERNAQDTVYCSCRCKGPDPNANYCECPSGYECAELVKELGLPGRAQLAGSYCIKQGTVYDAARLQSGDRCSADVARTEGGRTRDLCRTPECADVGANPGASTCGSET